MTRRSRTQRHKADAVAFLCPGCRRTIRVYGRSTTYVPDPGGATPATYMEPLPGKPFDSEKFAAALAEHKARRQRELADNDGSPMARVQTVLAKFTHGVDLMLAHQEASGQFSDRQVRCACRCGFARIVTASELFELWKDCRARGERSVTL